MKHGWLLERSGKLIKPLCDVVDALAAPNARDMMKNRQLFSRIAMIARYLTSIEDVSQPHSRCIPPGTLISRTQLRKSQRPTIMNLTEIDSTAEEFWTSEQIHA